MAGASVLSGINGISFSIFSRISSTVWVSKKITSFLSG
nr:MAG TPA: hypothetical protein [Caudoviricetes sp.]